MEGILYGDAVITPIGVTIQHLLIENKWFSYVLADTGVDMQVKAFGTQRRKIMKACVSAMARESGGRLAKNSWSGRQKVLQNE